MNIYEIDSQMTAIIATMMNDDGVIDENAAEALEQLQMVRDKKIENLACAVKNLNAFAEDLKAEKAAIAERQARAEKKAAYLSAYLQSVLNGEKPQSAKYAISYRNTKSVEITDAAAVIGWCEKEHADCLKIEVSPKKDALKKLLLDGVCVDGAAIKENISMQIK